MDPLLIVLVPLLVLAVVMLFGFTGCDFPDVNFFTPPTGLQAKATGPKRVELTWQDHSNGTTAYFVERMDYGQPFRTNVGRVAAGSLVDTSPGLMEGTSYSYVVRPDVTWDNPTETNQAAVTTPPAPPGGLTAVPGGGSSINLSWVAAKPYTFTLEHRPGGSGGAFQTIYVGGAPSFSHTGLAPASAHEYRVIAAVAGVAGEVRSEPSGAVSAATGAAAVWKQAFAATLTTNPAQRDGDCIVQRLAAPLGNGGTKVRITVRGSTTAPLVLDAVTISEAAPAAAGVNPWDSAALPVKLFAAGNPVVSIPASTAVVLDVANYTLNPARDQIIAFDINTPDGAVRSGPRAGDKAFARNNTHEAGAQNRATGYGTTNNTVFIVEKVEVQ